MLENGNFKTLITVLLITSIVVGLYANYLQIKQYNNIEKKLKTI